MSEPFARVPLWILGRSDVSWAAKILYGLLARYVGAKGREAWPSVEQLRADMRTSRRNVERWLEELRGAGLLEVARTGRANTYRLLGTQPEAPPEGGVLIAPAPSEVADQIRQSDRIRSVNPIGSDPPEVADQTRQEWRISAPSTVSQEEIIEEIIEESASATTEAPRVAASPIVSAIGAQEALVDRAQSLLLRGYQERYERLVGDVWMGAGRVLTDIRACARWCAAKPPAVSARVEALLEGMFDPGRTRFAAERWPWAWVARNPESFVGRPPVQGRAREGFVALQAKPGEFGSDADYGDADIPAEPPPKVIRYG